MNAIRYGPYRLFILAICFIHIRIDKIKTGIQMNENEEVSIALIEKICSKFENFMDFLQLLFTIHLIWFNLFTKFHPVQKLSIIHVRSKMKNEKFS